jgi:biopolymer transport protein ExbB/TolQ
MERGMAAAGERAAAVIHLQMSRGLTSLATIASVAPFVGLFGTVLGMINSFRGSCGSQSAELAMVTQGISESLATTALGLLVAIPAVWLYWYLHAQLDAFDSEMAGWNSLVPRRDS